MGVPLEFINIKFQFFSLLKKVGFWWPGNQSFPFRDGETVSHIDKMQPSLDAGGPGIPAIPPRAKSRCGGNGCAQFRAFRDWAGEPIANSSMFWIKYAWHRFGLEFSISVGFNLPYFSATPQPLLIYT
jgi:hypothetical protein